MIEDHWHRFCCPNKSKS